MASGSEDYLVEENLESPGGEVQSDSAIEK